MKLWQKISLICITILLTIVILCSTLLLLHARESMLALTIEQAQFEQKNLTVSFNEMVQFYITEERNTAAKRSGIKYCFSRFANNTSVLMSADATLYSYISIDPERFLPIDYNNEFYEQAVFLDKIDARHILIVGSKLSLLDDNYLVYTVKDVTKVYHKIQSMIWYFIFICVIGITVGTLLIMLLVHRISKPLTMLMKATHRIADGKYNERVQILSKDEAGVLAADFNVMAKAVESHIADLEETAKRRQLFIGAITHEFKTPMTSMIIHTKTLLSTDLSKEDTQKSLTHIHAQCKWLESLTQKLLKLITLQETIKMRIENVHALFEDVSESTYETLRQRGTPLIVKCDIDSLNVDYDLMKSLLVNLVDNASKASEPGDMIKLQASGNTISVQDNGIGIAQEELSRITDPFYVRDYSRSKRKGGSGLGLALVKHIAEAHDAQMVIESEQNVGTTVKIVFPNVTASL